ncbi:MAG: DUF4836 family protein [Bacteroidota bacterium]
MSKKLIIILGSSLGVLTLAGLFWYLSLSNNKELIKRIPQNAMVIGKIDLKSLASKAKLDEWKNLEMFKDIKEELNGSAGDTFGKMLEKPKGSGFNFFQNVYVFGANKGSNEDSEFMGGIVFGVLDAKDLKTTLYDITEGDAEITESNEVFTAELDREVAMVWDDNVGLIYFGDRESLIVDALAQFNQEKDASALKNDAFMEQESLDADISVFINYQSIGEWSESLSRSFGESNMNDLSASYKDYEAAGTTVVFEDEQIILESQIYLKEGVDEDTKQMTGDDGISEEELALYAPETPKGFVLFNLALQNLAPIWTPMLDEWGITSQELTDAFSGQMGISFMGVKEQEVIEVIEDYDYENWDIYTQDEPPLVTYNDTSYQMLPVFKIRFGIKNQGTVRKMIEFAEGKSLDSLEKRDGYYYIGDNDLPMFMNMDNESLELVSSKEYFGKSSNSWDSDLASFASSAPGTFYLNLDYKAYPELMKDMGRNFNEMRPYLEMFKDVRGTMQGLNSHFEINLTESDEPVLYRLMLAINDTYKNNKPMKEVSAIEN